MANLQPLREGPMRGAAEELLLRATPMLGSTLGDATGQAKKASDVRVLDVEQAG